MMLVLAGRLRMRIGSETRDMGPGEVALILSDQEHEQTALEDGTRFVSFKSAVGQLPDGDS
jgi:quercetin dioxygenase-like cupin family protein